LSNAAATTAPGTLVWLSGLRWPIERAFQECKGELGMDHYETRTWRGWHHHQTLIILAHHFLVRLGLRLKKTALTVPQVGLLLTAVLPRRLLDPAAAIALVARLQQQNYAAYRSHHKNQRTRRRRC